MNFLHFFRPLVAPTVALLLMLVATACGSDPKHPAAAGSQQTAEQVLRLQKLQAEALYRVARKSLDSGDYATAIERYGMLILRFPFSDQAVQGQMEKIYATYRSYQPDEAITEADRFLRDYPRNAHADYVQYLKGLVNFNREQGLADTIGLDTSRHDVSHLRRAFDDFALLIQRYPDSAYVGDARARMIDLRNRIAVHELTVVDYYMRRGAYLAAARRANDVVEQYPGAPSTLEALDLLQKAYNRLGLKDLENDARNLRIAYAQAAKAMEPEPAAPAATDESAVPPPSAAEPPAESPAELPVEPST